MREYVRGRLGKGKQRGPAAAIARGRGGTRTGLECGPRWSVDDIGIAPALLWFLCILVLPLLYHWTQSVQATGVAPLFFGGEECLHFIRKATCYGPALKPARSATCLRVRGGKIIGRLWLLPVPTHDALRVGYTT